MPKDASPQIENGGQSDEVRARRRYHAPVRHDQAEMTRQRILAAAREIFAERGYAATTVEAIAERAAVATPTVYAGFRSKRQLLIYLVLQIKELHNVPERVKSLMVDSDPHALLRTGAQVSRDFNAAAWDLLDVLRGAGRADAELAGLWQEIEGWRLRDQQQITRHFSEAGLLNGGLSAERAADLFWSLSSHDLYRLLVVERGWSDEEYENWLAGLLDTQLLG